MKDFIAYLIKNIVEDPAAVSVEIHEREQGMFVDVRVAEKDIARVVCGRQGRTINALRTIAITDRPVRTTSKARSRERRPCCCQKS